MMRMMRIEDSNDEADARCSMLIRIMACLTLDTTLLSLFP